MKKIIENIGVITWFLMDASWMMEAEVFAYIFMSITILLFLIPPKRNIGKYTTADAANFGTWLSTISWVLMNSLWMFNDLTNHIYKSDIDIFNFFFIFMSVSGFIIVCFTDINKFKNIRKIK